MDCQDTGNQLERYDQQVFSEDHQSDDIDYCTAKQRNEIRLDDKNKHVFHHDMCMVNGQGIGHRQNIKLSLHDKRCLVCNERFPRRDHLIKHMRVVHDILQPYQCVSCLKRYSNYKCLKRHRQSVCHRRKADWCKDEFKHLEAREYVKTDADDDDDGDDTVIDSSDTYSYGESVFHCVFCSKPFFRKSALLKHIKELHKVIQPYQCVSCLKRYASCNTLWTHRNSFCRKQGSIKGTDSYTHPSFITNCCFRKCELALDDVLSCKIINDNKIAMMKTEVLVGYVTSYLFECFSRFLKTGRIFGRISGAESFINGTLQVPVDYIFYGDKDSLYDLMVNMK